MKKKTTINIVIGFILLCLTICALAIVKKKDNERREKYETAKLLNDNFLVESDMDADQSLLEHLDFDGLSVNYEPKWVVNTFIVDADDFGKVHIASFNVNADDYHVSYVINWYKIIPDKTLDQMVDRCKKDMLAQYKSKDIKTSTTAVIPCEWNGLSAKSFDLTARLNTYIINRRAILFRNGTNEFRIEMASDLSRESLDTYFEDLQRRMKITNIDEL